MTQIGSGPRPAFSAEHYPSQELTREVIGAFYTVYNHFGFGFLESVYKKALVVECRYRGLNVSEELRFELPLPRRNRRNLPGRPCDRRPTHR